MTTLDKLVAAARNDALDAAADTCRDVGATDAERLIRSMRSVVAPPASAYGIDLDALSSIPEQGVKALEWRDGRTNFQAQGVGFLGYVTAKDADGYPGAFWYGDKPFDTLDEAKAAAQADFEARILSALVAPSQPAAVAVTDEMVERACRHTEQGWDAYLAKGGSYLRWADERRAEMRQTLVAALVDRDRVLSSNDHSS